jgi:hypothetical protein
MKDGDTNEANIQRPRVSSRVEVIMTVVKGIVIINYCSNSIMLLK